MRATNDRAPWHGEFLLPTAVAVRATIFATIGLTLALAGMSALGRDIDADEFNSLAAQIQNPPIASWLQHAYSPNAMPIPGDRDPVDVLLRRATTLLDELNQDGLLDSAAQRLVELEEENVAVNVAAVPERLALFRKVSEVSRRVASANPLLKFRDIVFLKRQKARYDHMVDGYFGFHAVAGGGIFVLQNALSDNPTARDVLADAVCQNGRFMGQKLNFGSFLSPSLSYDGRVIYFCHTEAAGPTYTWNEHTTFHIFKVNADGTGLRQLTDGPVNDLFPYPLPNGRIVFVSERRGGYGRCHARLCPTYTLHTMNADGTDITLLSAHETNEWQPWVDNNGMIIYSRWDYVDRGDDQAHHPWITYPDGRDARSIHGNWKEYGSASPYMEQDIRSIPGSHKYVGTAAPHHGQTFGSLILIDPRVEDDNRMSPLKVLTPDAQFPEATTGAGNDWKFATAWALSERFYLCAYSPTANYHALTLLDAKTGLKTVIYHDPSIISEYPIPLVPRPAPPLIPHRVASGLPLLPGQTFDPGVYTNLPTTGNVALMNVYDSTLPFPTNTAIKYLRIMEVLPKTTPDHITPHIGYAQEKPARRVLGTVPVESDGSAYFTLAADTPVFFQALDANREAVQSMRSLTYVKPGETLVCAGCHEKRGRAPATDLQPIAVQRAPSTIAPESDGSNPFSYPRLVQPVLDAKCVTCHQQQSALDLSAGDYPNNFNYWYNSYLNLRDFAFYYGAYANTGYDTWNTPTSVPGQVGAKGSRLYREVLRTNHYGLSLASNELHRLTLWLDSNSDFFGAYENTLAQAAQQIVHPINPRVTGYQTVTNTVYGPAIPLGPTNAINTNHGLSQFGTPLELSAPLSPGMRLQPLTLGQQAEGGLPPAEVDAGPDALAYVSGAPTSLNGVVTIQGQPAVPGTVLVWWSLVAGATNVSIANPLLLSTTVTFTQPGSYVFRLFASTGVTTNRDDVVLTVLPANQSPLVDAGPDQILASGTTNVVLNGSVLDDHGTPPATWIRVSGPGFVVFNPTNSPVCSAQISTLGHYVFRLTASDGIGSNSDECSVQILPVSSNAPPSVFAGNDINTSFTNSPILLLGSVSDDGLPGLPSVAWTVISGPGSVTFSNASAATTTAYFSQFGYYLLQLTATDGDRTAYDQLAVYLYPGDGTLALGSITREVWTGLSGNAVSALTSATNYPNNPSSSGVITSFQVPNNTGDNYGSRVHGYLCPPTTGNYTFWLASDDNGELWLSTNSSPGGVRLIASVPVWTDPLQWNKYPAQQSTPVSLQAGQAYYIRALQKEGGGGDHLAVAWHGPEIPQSVIDGAYLARMPVALPPVGSITREFWTAISGSAVANLTQSANYPGFPSGTATVTSFEAPGDWAENYGSRIRGLLHPPADGTYTFWIASDDNSELWLSTNSSPQFGRLIASVPVWTSARQWTKYASQQSAPVSLRSNQTYYIMALQKEGNGGDNLAVGWRGPGMATTNVIAGQYLSDYVETGNWMPPPSSDPIVLERNQRPQVDAGIDQEISFDDPVAMLRGRAFDDGLPVVPGALSLQWRAVGGPGSVTFSNATSAFTYAVFSAPGKYLLSCEASDGELTDSDTLAVTVNDHREYDFFFPSPQELAFAPDGRLIAASDVGFNRVVLIDRSSAKVLGSVPVEGTPRGIAWETTNTFWVCEYDAGSLAKVDAAQGRVTRRIVVGVKPYDVKLDSSRGRLVVTDYGLAQVSIADLASGTIVTNIPVVERPMYLALTPNQQFAVVANSEPKGDARDLAFAATISLLNLNTFAVTELPLPPGSTSLRGLAVSPDGRWIYAAHLLSRTYLPTTQLNNGWVLNNVVSILDLTNRQVYAIVPLDAFEEGAANPWGLGLGDRGQTGWVSASGVHELLRLDLAAIHSYLAADPQRRAGLDSDLVTLYEQGWITRHKLPGKGPRGLALSPDEQALATAMYFSGAVHLRATASAEVNQTIATGVAVPEHALRRGERLYFDGDGCFQRWLSCASCHPGARADGLNWDLVNDGIGNPKNTKSHVYSTATPPAMVTGVRASVAVAIQAGFKFIQFQQRSDQEMQDVFDFMASLRPEPGPKLNRHWLTPAALRGKAIFNDPVVRCANCHSGDYFTDLKKYDVGTGHPADVGPYDPIYDTPTLHELWRSGPYLHDGSAATLQDVLTTQNAGDRHGVTSHLSTNQIDDLVAYLEQIGGTDNWVNGAPSVYAGCDQLITLPTTTIQLAAMAEDDGLPDRRLALAWSLQSGPGPVSFGNSNLPATTAAFTMAGEYVLACGVTDGERVATDTMRVTVRPVGTPADSDSDGLVDQWEYHYFGALNASNGGPDDDWDSDGLTNLHEYVTGTDPKDANSGFHLKIARLNGQVVVSFTAHAAGTPLTPGNRFFTLQSCVPNGGQMNWSNMPGRVDVLGAGQVVEWTGPDVQAVRLFRVLVALRP